jgi:hypothetical protein
MIYVPETDYVGTETAVQNYDPSFGFLAKEAFRLGLRDTTISLAASLEAMTEAEKEGKISREEYEQSQFFDPDIKYDDSFTYAKARLLKERIEQERLYDYYLQQMSGLDYVAGFTGLIGGSIPDPINFIPMLGAMSKPARALEYAGVTSKVARRGMLGAADAAIASTLVSPLLMAERGTYQQKYDVQDALIDIGLATGIGFGFGSLLGRIKPDDSFPPRATTVEDVKTYAPELSDQLDNMLPEDRLYANRMMDFVEGVSPDMRARATYKAMSQVGRNEPINVNAEMQPVLSQRDVQKARITGTYYNESPTRRFTEDAVQVAETEVQPSKTIEPDYTVARTEDPIPLVDDLIEAVEKQTDDELDTGIRELETQNLLPDEDARELVRLEDLTTPEAQREIEEYYGNLAYCVMRNG